ncbi:MAG TPA: trimeric intracellular cation channel family protein [Rhodopila sp.]|jgi:uncharacterized membrane protein YeiH|nr:trimeric intracellular cation channel family protein [Rhodopila sp.]
MVRFRASSLVTFADLTGTFVFAVEGAMVAMQNHLDVLGVLILSFATAVGGGIIRDVLIGATPPEALRHWLYPSIALGGGALAFAFVGAVQRLPNPALIGLDAVGLSLFAVAGTEKALDRGLPTLVAICLGAITATGGGTMRDVLLARIPVILRTDVYATAALAGAVVMVAIRKAGGPTWLSALIGGLVCFGLRLTAVWQGWNLPRTMPGGL